MIKSFLPILFIIQAYGAFITNFPRVDGDLKIYDDTVVAKNVEFEKTAANPTKKNWVKLKLSHMVDVDQYARAYLNTPFQHGYTADEKKYFQRQFDIRLAQVDTANTKDLKKLLRIYSWFNVSVFGAQSDRDAWLLVQHADQDFDFQKQVLSILEKLYVSGETNPTNYAYLFDRVAASFKDPSLRKPQRYGTQGACTGPGTWEPFPVEDLANLDVRRKSVGLGAEAEYIKMFKDICH